MTTRPRTEDVRAELLRHAALAFDREGYVKASLARIAADAGYTKGAVYSGFGGKAQLFAQVCGQEIERSTVAAMRGVERVLAEDGLDRAALARRMAAALADTVLEGAGRWSVLLHEFQTVALRDEAVAAEYARLADRRREFLVSLLEPHEHFAGLGGTELARRGELILLVVHGLAVERHLRPEAAEREAAVATLAAVMDAVLP